MTQEKDFYKVKEVNFNFSDEAPKAFEFPKDERKEECIGYSERSEDLEYTPSAERRNRVLLGVLLALSMSYFAWRGYVTMKAGRSFWTGLFALAYCSSAAIGILYESIFRKDSMWYGLLLGLLGPLSVLFVLAKVFELCAYLMPTGDMLCEIKKDEDGHRWLNDSVRLD